VNKGGEFFSCHLNSFIRSPPKYVAGVGGISVLMSEIGNHSVQHFLLDRSGGVIVKVDGPHNASVSVEEQLKRSRSGSVHDFVFHSGIQAATSPYGCGRLNGLYQQEG